MRDIVMPSIGVAMTEGTISKWLKAPGDDVSAGDLVAEVETDKAQFEIESPAAGRLGEHLFPEGTTVEVDEVIARVYEAGDEES